MESIKEIFKIGLGPSSSHTIAPTRASSIFKERHPEAESFRVTLYGSLAATGKGHMTDKAIIKAFSPKPVEILWHSEIVHEFHTNGMYFEAVDTDGKVLEDWTVYSVGGGSLAEDPAKPYHIIETPKDVYEFRKMSDIMAYLDKEGLTYWEYVEMREGPDIWDYLSKVWNVMQKSVEDGLEDGTRLPGFLKLRSKARQAYMRASGYKDNLRSRGQVIAYALAVSEMNARGGMVVTAPTCGSCGVIPGVLYHMMAAHEFSEKEILKALATAGLFGNIIKYNASLAGAEVGCQGEVGSACVMAAVAVNQIFEASIRQTEYAASMAMEHNLGLTCDPIGGLVLIPCISRNAYAALRALDVSLYSLLSDGRHVVSFDKVVDTMKRTGKDLPSLYKETATGGLATLDLHEF